jgi:hypothetical protein
LIFNYNGKVNKNERHIRLIIYRKKQAVLNEMINKKYIIMVAIGTARIVPKHQDTNIQEEHDS